MIDNGVLEYNYESTTTVPEDKFSLEDRLALETCALPHKQMVKVSLQWHGEHIKDLISEVKGHAAQMIQNKTKVKTFCLYLCIFVGTKKKYSKNEVVSNQMYLFLIGNTDHCLIQSFFW